MIISIGILLHTVSFSQSCLPEGIIFNTQAQIDSFQINYPNCTQIEGYVLINGKDITNLNGLNTVSYIGHYLDILDNDSLLTLDGLENLTTVITSFTIEYNANLYCLEGLDSINYVGDLYISGNPSLSSLNGIENLTLIDNGLTLYYNVSLTNIEGLENVNADSLRFITIRYNESLCSCSIKSICEFLENPSSSAHIAYNSWDPGCNSREQVEAACGVGVMDKTISINPITLFPNPTSDRIIIELPEAKNKSNITTLTIFNINGQCVIKRKMIERRTVLDITWIFRSMLTPLIRNKNW